MKKDVKSACLDIDAAFLFVAYPVVWFWKVFSLYSACLFVCLFVCCISSSMCCWPFRYYYYYNFFLLYSISVTALTLTFLFFLFCYSCFIVFYFTTSRVKFSSYSMAFAGLSYYFTFSLFFLYYSWKENRNISHT